MGVPIEMMPSAPATRPATRPATEPRPLNQGQMPTTRPPRRSKTWSVVLWLPIIATMILAVFAVVQAFGKMH